MQLDNAGTDEEINLVLEHPSVMMIINSSRWSVTEMITKANKSALLQLLIWEEVVKRREENLMAFRKGMNVLGMLDMLKNYPVLTRPLLVAEDDAVLTSKEFRSLIGSSKPVVPEEIQSYNRFMEFIEGIIV